VVTPQMIDQRHWQNGWHIGLWDPPGIENQCQKWLSWSEIGLVTRIMG
jgi:hypothetical protein